MKVFNELRNLYQEKEQNNLVIFVGAGISENYANIKDGKKFPSWKTLVESLVPEDMDKTSIIDSLKIAQIFQDNYSKEALAYKVKELFPQDYDSHEIHQLIFDLEPAHVLTTNYDHLLEKALQVNGLDNKYHIIDADEAIPLSRSKQNLLVKAHGDICRGNIILSEQDYNEYEQKFPLILSFIRYVFSKHKVLFIGFSLSDPNFNKILFWVKNILDENSIKHTVILHNDISESERIYFEKKSVRVLTKNEIVDEIIEPDNVNKGNELYLLEALEFIKNGYPQRLYSIKNRFNILKKNLQYSQYFEYLIPEIVSSFFWNTKLEFTHYELAESLENNGKKEKRYPWLANIFSLDGQFNLIKEMSKPLEERNKEFFNEYFNDIVDIFLLSNIGSISYTNAPECQRIILNQVTDLYKLPENGNYKLTYQLEDNKFSEVDSSFEKNSPYYNILCLSSDDFFTYYLLGNIGAYDLLKKESYTDLNEKYLYYYRLHYLINGNLIGKHTNDKKLHESIFVSMNRYSQKVFASLHHLKFVQLFIDYMIKTEQNFKEYLSRNFKTFGGWNGKDLYQVSFYIQYSQFLKFIFLNKLPILQNERVSTAIHLANQFYFNYFFEVKNNKVDIPNWILIGIALDNKPKEIRETIIKFHNDLFSKQIEFEFDKVYLKDLFLTNLELKKSDKCLVHFENIFYMLGLFSTNEDIFDLSLEVFLQFMKSDIKYIDIFGEAFHISVINFKKRNNMFSEFQIQTISDILNQYITYKITNNDISIKEDNFVNIIWSLEKNIFHIRNEDICEKLKSIELNFLNINLFVRTLWLLGYTIDDLEELVEKVKLVFNEENFYSIKDYSSKNFRNEIENTILTFYLIFKKDFGLEKIKDHYLSVLKENLQDSGYNSIIGDAFEWLNLFIDNRIYKKEIVKELTNPDIFNRFKKQLVSISISSGSIDIFGSSKPLLRNGLYMFIKIHKFDNIDEKLGLVLSSLDVIKFLSNWNLINLYSKHIIDFLNAISTFDNRMLIISLSALLKTYKKQNEDLDTLLSIINGAINEYSKKTI